MLQSLMTSFDENTLEVESFLFCATFNIVMIYGKLGFSLLCLIFSKQGRKYGQINSQLFINMLIPCVYFAF